MSQQFQVLRCCECFTFQAHQVKKSYKWACKMCSVKQSIKRNYGTGSGKDCRLHVQKLNSTIGEIKENTNVIEQNNEDNSPPDESSSLPNTLVLSKWNQYLDTSENTLSCLLSDSDPVNQLTNISPDKFKVKFQRKRKIKQFENNSIDDKFSKSINYLTSDSCEIPQEFKPQLYQEKCQNDCKSEAISETANKTALIHLKIKENSKWAHFIEEEEVHLHDQKILSGTCQSLLGKNACNSKTVSDLFSINDDNIDDILDNF